MKRNYLLGTLKKKEERGELAKLKFPILGSSPEQELIESDRHLVHPAG